MRCPFGGRHKYSMRTRKQVTEHKLVEAYVKGARANLGYWYRDGVKWNRHGAVT